MNQSKLYEWLLDNDCPFDFDFVDQDECISSRNQWDGKCTLIFSDKEVETEVRDMTDKEYWNSSEIKELLA